jgi:hypothetical protein
LFAILIFYVSYFSRFMFLCFYAFKFYAYVFMFHTHLFLFLFLSFNRIRINGVGVFDVINYESDKDPSHFQREDLLSLGKLILSLACKSPTAVNNLTESLEFIGTQYSPDLKNLVVCIFLYYFFTFIIVTNL